MKYLIVFASVCLVLCSCERVDVPVERKAGQQSKTEEQYIKELDEIRDSIHEEVRIKVKRDAKGYSWEISGKDTKEVLKANDILRKRLDN